MRGSYGVVKFDDDGSRSVEMSWHEESLLIFGVIHLRVVCF
jgi:hypothetical protein